MGSQNSHIKEYSQEGFKNFQSNFTFVKTYDDPRLSRINIFSENTSGKLISLLNKDCRDELKTNKIRDELISKVDIEHDNLLKIVGYVRRSEGHLCGGSDVFTIFIEWYEHDLELEIVERAKNSVKSIN